MSELRQVKLSYLLFLFILTPFVCRAGDDTALMFVGEDMDVLTIASGREQGAWSAPAVADVILRSDISDSDMTSLKDVLDKIPGFLTMKNEWGYNTYMRGVSNGVLFMHDAAPLGSKLNKEYSGFDPFLSLESVKRVEIIRGPGSVLWGSDAFAGIVNIVPLTGKDFQGIETGIRTDSDGGRSAYATLGCDKSRWDGFLSVNAGEGDDDGIHANLVQFWGNSGRPVDAALRTGDLAPEKSRYFEFTGNSGVPRGLRLSTRMAAYDIPYASSDHSSDSVWQERQKAWTGYVKAEGSIKQGLTSGFRLTGLFSWFEPETRIVDLVLNQKEKIFFGEIIYEKSLFGGNGLLTTGTSLRRTDAGNVPVWDSYYPDYFTDDNASFLPSVEYHDYSSTTFSLFGQYLQKIGGVDVWVGIREEDHDVSGAYLSYNTGFSWNEGKGWICKMVYGNAYRTPYAKQIQEGKKDMENIETISFTAGWRPGRKGEVSLTFFGSRLQDYLAYDLETGISEPGKQNIKGVELKAEYTPVKSVELSTGLSLIDSSGQEVWFRYNDYSYPENGQIIDHYVDIYSPYDPGPRKRVHTSLVWRPWKGTTVHGKIQYSGPGKICFPAAGVVEEYSGTWLCDLGLKISNVFETGFDVTLSGKNILDQDHELPGKFGLVEGDRAVVSIKFTKSW